MPYNIIRKNKAKCLHCHDILISTPENKVKTCSCGILTISGGHSHIIRSGKRNKDYEELSVLIYDDVPNSYNDEEE
jgi:hypothetical protein